MKDEWNTSNKYIDQELWQFQKSYILGRMSWCAANELIVYLFFLLFSQLNTMQTKRHGNVYNLNGLNSSWLNIGILTSSWENQNFSKTMRFSIDNNLTIVSILQIRELIKMDVKNETKIKPNKQTVKISDSNYYFVCVRGLCD